MKLIQEYIVKASIFVFALSIVMELSILILTIIRSSQNFIETYQQITLKSEKKSIFLSEKIKNFTIYILLKYTTDLKLIGKHSLLLNGKKGFNSSFAMNRNYQIFVNNNKKKEIISAELKNLLQKDYMAKLYNKSLDKFDYITKYEEEYKNTSDQNAMLNKLLNDHPELNSIAYYSLTKDKPEDELNIKFIISAIKTVYIKRYLGKRSKMDYLHFIILNEDEIYVYPPKAYNHTNLYEFDIIYPPPYSKCNYSSNNISHQFPLCAYNFFKEKVMDKEDNYISVVYERIIYEKAFAAICLKLCFAENNMKQAFLCIEIDFSLFIGITHIGKIEKLEFGIFNKDLGDIIILIYSKSYLYEDIKKTFNDTYSQRYILDGKNNFMFYLFHILYYNLTKVAKEHPELKVNFTEIEEEYNTIKTQILYAIEGNKNSNETIIRIPFIKSVCQKGLLINTYECFKDTFEIIINPLIYTIQILSEDYLETIRATEKNLNIYVFSILSINPEYNNQLISTIIRIKIERTIILFFFLTVIVLSFFILLINILSELSLNPINKIINELKKININNDSKKFYTLKEDKIIAINKEMYQLKNIYETMRKSLIIKQVFEKESFLDQHNLEFYNLVQNIDKINIKEICNSYLGFYHFKNDAFNLSETEFNSVINFIIDQLNIATAGKNSEYEDKIKDAIKRSSTVSYINEFSKFEKIEENLLIIINLNIFKQRFMYLYAMTKFKLGSEANNNNNINIGQSVALNKKNKKKNKDKKIKHYKDAIKYFNECRNINILLGINQIKVIYCLIMISKCYMELNDYRNSINSINEALSLFFEFSKSFKDYHSKNYNPKIMLFIENNIFHYIVFTIERICSFFNKPFACNWIILKIFETSPFLIENVHYHSALFIQNYLEKNKLKLNKADSKFLTNASMLKEYEKNKNYFSKIVSRMKVKNVNNKIIKTNTVKSLGDSNYSSYRTRNDSKTEKSIFSSNFKREMATGKSTSFHYKVKNLNKIVTLCLSEKILEKVNGLELKDVIVKYFQKYFIMNENDKFNFIQFANNGKKAVYFKMEQLDYFLLKIQKTKNTFELGDSFIPNKNSPFMELFNIFDSIIKNYPQTEENITDNIIIMFINSDDIRFTSINECLNIVEELNKKNTSVFLLSYDDEIKKDKINNIQSFLDGLFEGYFFRIKSYQQLKQIFINLSVLKHQSNFFGYDFNALDNEI